MRPIFVLIGALLSAAVLLTALVVFNMFALTLIFSYFNDVVYEAIFFFIALAVSLNIGVALGKGILKTLYE